MSLVIFISVATAIVLILFRLKKKKSQSTGINSQPKADQVAGIKDYAGVTGNIKWKLTSSVWFEDSGRSSSKALSRSWNSKSVWQTDAIKLPAGKFIMLMSTPGEVKTSDIKRGGFVNKMINMAADMALDVYVSGYFGNAYKALVSIGEEGVKIEREELKDFMILTNVQPLAEKYFDAATASTIASWKKMEAGFLQEEKVDQFGLLFSPDGVTLSCMANMDSENEVKIFSDFGSVLTTKMIQISNT
jgi:hypothetical protein